MSRSLWDIPGGIHPPQRKTLSNHQSIRQAPLPKRLVLPLQQHIGAPASPLVAVGDYVLTGQKIAEAEGFVSAPLHAPSSGTVVEIAPHNTPHPSGMSDQCIVIETDGEDNWCPLEPLPNFHELETEVLVTHIREAGIAGLGGAGFPSAVKLRARPEQEINTLIINGTECEPYITADDLLMQEQADEIITGIEILNQIVKPSEILIGIEDDKPLAITQLQNRIKSRQLGFEVVPLPTKYPSGGEKQLIQILTGKEVPSGELPADLGIVCQNVGTAKAIHDAVVIGKPLISRITTLTGEALEQPGNMEVLIGTPIEELLQHSGVDQQHMQRLIVGGPMMGFTLQDASAPIIKTINCLIASSADELPPPLHAQACIRCGACSEACPVNLLPQQLYWHSRAKDYSQLKHHNLFDCIECGACSYSCPSHIPLVQYYRASKADIRAHEAMQQKAEYSKMRFEARESRIQRAEAEKAAKRKANAERAAKLKAAKLKAAKENAALNPATQESSDDPKNQISAAISRSKNNQANATSSPLTAEEKSLKIQRSMVNAQLKKLQRQLENCASDEREKLNAHIDRLNQQLQQLSSNGSSSSKAAAVSDKERTIKLAMARAAVKKTQRALSKIDTDSEDASRLREELATQETTLGTLQAESAEPPLASSAQQTAQANNTRKSAEKPSLDEKASPDKKPSSEEKKLIIVAAMAKAALKKTERAYAEAAENHTAETEKLATEVVSLKLAADEANLALETRKSQSQPEGLGSTQSTAETTPKPVTSSATTDALNKLKIHHAMANAALKKAQRAVDISALEASPEQQLAIQQAEQQLVAASKALNDFTTENSVEG